MSHAQEVMRDLAVDGVKASPLAGAWWASAAGVIPNSYAEWAALASFVYAVFLIVDKLRAWGFFRWLKRMVARAVPLPPDR